MSPSPTEPYFVRINSERCRGSTAYVLEPEGDIVQLQQKDHENEAQHWQLIPTFDMTMQCSGVVLQNVHTTKALLWVARGQPVTTKVWHPDLHDETYLWYMRPSRNGNHPHECAIVSVVDGSVCDANGHEPCQGAHILAYDWKDNNNQYYVVEAV